MNTPKENAAKILKDLKDGSPHVRLKAARQLGVVGVLTDVAVARVILREERVSYVRKALTQAISRIEGNMPVAEPVARGDGVSNVAARQIKADALKRATGLLLHELHPRVGSIAMEAKRSVQNYETSRLAVKIADLESILRAFEELRKATQTDLIVELDIGEFVRERLTRMEIPEKVSVNLSGEVGVTATVDPDLLGLAFCNGLKNAFEAVSSGGEGGKITISWGATEVDTWITVSDDGPGILGSSNAAFDPGRSTKAGHMGFGLTIAQQAMNTIDGSVTLSANAPSGVIYEMRWF